MLTQPDGRLADVRIVQVQNTRLYIPTSWLKASWLLVDFEKASYAERRRLEGDTEPPVWELERDYHPDLQPDAHLEECPGTVHATRADLSNFRSIRLQFHRRDGVHVDATNISSDSIVSAINLTNKGETSGTTAAGAAEASNQVQKLRPLTEKAGPDGWRALVNNNTYLDEEDARDDLNRSFIVYINNNPWGTSAEQWVLPDVMFRYEARVTRDEMGVWRGLRQPMRTLAEWLATPPSRRDNERMFSLKPVL